MSKKKNGTADPVTKGRPLADEISEAPSFPGEGAAPANVNWVSLYSPHRGAHVLYGIVPCGDEPFNREYVQHAAAHHYQDETRDSRNLSARRDSESMSVHVRMSGAHSLESAGSWNSSLSSCPSSSSRSRSGNYRSSCDDERKQKQRELEESRKKRAKQRRLIERIEDVRYQSTRR